MKFEGTFEEMVAISVMEMGVKNQENKNKTNMEDVYLNFYNEVNMYITDLMDFCSIELDNTNKSNAKVSFVHSPSIEKIKETKKILDDIAFKYNLHIDYQNLSGKFLY